jgi:hypothetical protein
MQTNRSLPTGRGLRHLQIAGRLLLLTLVAALTAPAQGPGTATPPETKPEAKKSRAADPKDPGDSSIDQSKSKDKSSAIIPVAIPITEQTVGVGAIGALLFLKKPEATGEAGFARPNIIAVGGAFTSNGSRGFFAADVRRWKNNSIQTVFAFASISANLDFYGLRGEGQKSGAPLRYGLRPIGGLTQVRFRLGRSRTWAGVQYAFASTKVSFRQQDNPEVPAHEPESRVGGLAFSMSYDSRDVIFTPSRGAYIEASFGAFAPALGGTSSYQNATVTAIDYLRLGRRVTLGVRGDAGCSFGSAPFYTRPFLTLRGAPAMRYQGHCIAQTEEELRWQFWKRWSVVGFGGTGAAFRSFNQLSTATAIGTGGAGFRYELSSQFGMHVGMDVAYGPGGPAVYVVIGSAWMRP